MGDREVSLCGWLERLCADAVVQVMLRRRVILVSNSGPSLVPNPITSIAKGRLSNGNTPRRSLLNSRILLHRPPVLHDQSHQMDVQRSG
jgi:hypothetical protein